MRKVSALLLAAERRAISGLAGLYASRMLGLFMVLPVLALYADTLTGATPLLVGVALGIYGLTQATLQIPFGLLSDRIGRKRVIAMGLLIFAFGSVVAAMADSIGGVILGRALQGGRGGRHNGSIGRSNPRAGTHGGHGHHWPFDRRIVCHCHGAWSLVSLLGGALWGVLVYRTPNIGGTVSPLALGAACAAPVTPP